MFSWNDSFQVLESDNFIFLVCDESPRARLFISFFYSFIRRDLGSIFFNT
jgi:hypothetical protein